MAEELERVLPEKLEDRAHRVLERADARSWKLATAESCTGGLLAALLTDVPGLSHAFERGIVSYSDAAKCDLLDIAEDKVNDCGAVSREVAIAMADGALRRSLAQVAVSITGYAGPPGEDAPDGAVAGLVHFGCAVEGRETAHREERFGEVGRAGVRIAALGVALEMMEAALEDDG